MKPLGYTCKYTPLELLEALGGHPVLLNQESCGFPYAERVTHNQFCCHAKAVLEECRRTGLRELVLVNCCDCIRRVYDVLEAAGELDFLYLLDLPHHADGCSRALLKDGLERLAAAYAAYRGTRFDPAAFRAAFSPAPALPEGDFLAVTGARAGAGLLETLRRRSPLPVADLTCGGHRSLPPPPEGLEGPQLLDWYAGALLGQLPCMRMNEIGRRSELLEQPRLRGILYHTVKFCDYYSFEYEALRSRTSLPLLKLETDFTPQGDGQLSTRLEAFAEQLNLRGAPAVHTARRGRRYVAGIDSGSTTTNLAILDLEGSLRASAIVRTGPKARQGAEKALAALEGIGLDDLAAVVATGYGRSHIPFATGQVTEITCHARGAHHLHPQARCVIDIGGQDSKVICLDEDGGVKNFVMNDKCAAGTGRFFEVLTNRLMGVEMDELSDMIAAADAPSQISSMCTIFAESEIISHLSEGQKKENIIAGVGWAIARRIVGMGRSGRIPFNSQIVFSGGVANNRSIAGIFEQLLGKPVTPSVNPQSTAALGAAITAVNEYKK